MGRVPIRELDAGDYATDGTPERGVVRQCLHRGMPFERTWGRTLGCERQDATRNRSWSVTYLRTVLTSGTDTGLGDESDALPPRTQDGPKREQQ